MADNQGAAFADIQLFSIGEVMHTRNLGGLVGYVIGAVLMFVIGYAIVTRIPPLMRLITPASAAQ